MYHGRDAVEAHAPRQPRFFPRRSGAAGKRRSFHSGEREGKCRELDDAVEHFASDKIYNNTVVIDPAYALDGVMMSSAGLWRPASSRHTAG